MRLESGTRVRDYILVERLGAGAFGEVWKAAHVHLPRVAAIKFATSETAAAALEREGVAQFGLEHPGVVRVLDASLSFDPPYVVLEYVEGRSLRAILRERGRLEVQDFSSILGQLVNALAFAHRRGVVHGDLKPENILVVEQGMRKIVKLTDFQLGAYRAGRRPEEAEGGLRPSLGTAGPQGTVHYLAPEQETGEEIDGRADLFALGVVLFEMATGSLPQGRDLPSDLNPALSWWWDHIFSRSYTGRDRRYQTAEEMLEDLEAAWGGPRWGEMPSQRRAVALGPLPAGGGGSEEPAGTPGREEAGEAVLEAVPAAGPGAEAACGGPEASGPAGREVEARVAVLPGPKGVRAARPSRSPVLGGLAAGLLALAIPAGVIYSVAVLRDFARPCGPESRMEKPWAVQAASRSEDLDGLRTEFANAWALLREARDLRTRRALEQEVRWIQLRANRAGFFLFVDEDGRAIAVQRGR